MPKPYQLVGHARDHEEAYRTLVNTRPFRCGGMTGEGLPAWGDELAPNTALSGAAAYVRVRVSGLRLVRVVAEVSAGNGAVDLTLHRVKPGASQDDQGSAADRYAVGSATVELTSADTEYAVEIEPKGEEFIDVEMPDGVTITFVDVMGV